MPKINVKEIPNYINWKTSTSSELDMWFSDLQKKTFEAGFREGIQKGFYENLCDDEIEWVED